MEQRASNVGSEATYTSPTGGRFSDVERIGTGMVSKSSSESESESSYLISCGGCDGDESGLGTFDVTSSGGVGWGRFC